MGAGAMSVSGDGVNGPVKVADRERGVIDGGDNLASTVGLSSSTESIEADIVEIAGGRPGKL